MKRKPSPEEAKRLIGEALLKAYVAEVGVPPDMVALLAVLAKGDKR